MCTDAFIGERETTMRPPQMQRYASRLWLLIACLSLGAPSTALAQAEPAAAPESAGAAAQPAPTTKKPSLEVYGFVMLDIGENFTSIHPNWTDTMPPITSQTAGMRFNNRSPGRTSGRSA